MLTSVLAADLTQTRMKLLQQACAANMKQWGLAFDLYSQDYNGTFYYDVAGLHFDDIHTPLEFYFGTIDSGHTNLRNARVCPAVAAAGTANLVSVHSYNMPVGRCRKGFTYANADQPGSPYFRSGLYWPDLKSCPNPSQFLLFVECNGNNLHCGGLASAVSNPGAGSIGDPVPAINRHGGSVNCLFGDFHVELISAQVISNQDASGCGSNSWLALN
jgi:prepilin-type processing-associated H-X9-DG protein